MATERCGIAAWVLCAALAGVAAGCTPGGKGEAARAQYEAVLDALRGGSLERAYDAVMPPAYDRDLAEILTRARDLISEEEFGQLKALLKKLGEKSAPMVSLLGSSEASRVVAEKLKDLPAAIGITTHAELKALDTRKLLAGLDRGFFAALARTEDVQKRLRNASVRLAAEKGDWAQLKFVSRGESGAEEVSDTADVILLDGKWVPDGWVTDWPQQMDAIKARLGDVAAMKEQDPHLVRKQLEGLSRAVDDPAALLEGLGAQLGGLFGRPAPPEAAK